MRTSDVPEIALPDGAHAEAGQAAPPAVQVVALHHHHVATGAAPAVQHPAGGRALLHGRHDLEELVADGEQHVLQTELGHAGIVVAGLDAETVPDFLERRPELGSDQDHLPQPQCHERRLGQRPVPGRRWRPLSDVCCPCPRIPRPTFMASVGR